MKVLLLDKDTGFLDKTEAYLEEENEGLTIEKATEAEVGLKEISEKDYDAVVSGFRLSDGNVVELLRTIREEKDNDIPFIIFSRETAEEVLNETSGSDAVDYVRRTEDLKCQCRILAKRINHLLSGEGIKEEILEEIKKFPGVFDSLKDAIMVHDIKGQILWVNSPFTKMTGYEKAEVIGRNAIDIADEIVKSEDVKRAKDSLKGVLAGGEIPHMIITLISKEGDETPVSLTGSIIKNEDGEPISVIASGRDISDRKRLQRKYEKEKELLESSINNIQDIFGVLDFNGNLVRWNGRLNELSGYSDDELSSMHFTEFFREEDKDLIMSGMERLTGGEEVIDEVKLVSKNGDTVPIELRGSLLTDDEGNPRGFVGIGRDISERKEAQEKIERSETKYRTIFESASDAIFVMKGEKFWNCNEKTLEMFECDRDEIIGKFPWEFSPEEQPDGRESKEKAKEMISAAYSGEPQFFDWIHTRANGETFHAEVKLNRYELEDEEYLIAIVRDVTKRERAEERFRRLFEAAPDPTYLINKEGEIEAVNRAFEEVLGRDREKVIGKKTWELPFVTEESLHEIKKNFERRMEGENVSPYTIKSYEGNGEEHYSEANVQVLKEGGEIGGLVGITRDITDRVRAREREDFLHSLLRHDLRSKISVVDGYLDLLGDSDLSESQRDILKKAIKTVQKSDDLIDKVRTMRKVEEEKVVEDIRLGLVLSNVIDAYEDQAREGDIKLDHELPNVEVSAGPLLEELFGNLIENSIRHSNCDEIRIRHQELNGKIEVTVEDDGKGIPVEDKQKVFEKGFRIGETSSSGLGLYIVQRVADIYDLDIEISTPDYGGTKFTVSIEKA